MPEIAGRVADGFAERVRELEEQTLTPLAVRSAEAAAAGSGVSSTDQAAPLVIGKSYRL